MNNKNERKIKRGDIYLYDYGENEGSISLPEELKYLSGKNQL